MAPQADEGTGDDVRVVVLDGRALRNDWRAKVTRPVVGAALAVAGVICIVLGYWGVAHEAVVAKQLPYLVSGGIGGMVLVAVGAFILGTDDVRHQLERVERLESMVADLHAVLLHAKGTPAPSPAAAPSNGAAGSGGLVALPRGKSFHRDGCTMVVGKDVQPVDEQAIAERSLTPCPLCDPVLLPR